VDGNVSAGVVLSAIAFGAGHIYQGWRSAIIILVYGLLFGILAEFRKSLRPGMRRMLGMMVLRDWPAD